LRRKGGKDVYIGGLRRRGGEKADYHLLKRENRSRGFNGKRETTRRIRRGGRNDLDTVVPRSVEFRRPRRNCASKRCKEIRNKGKLE